MVHRIIIFLLSAFVCVFANGVGTMPAKYEYDFRFGYPIGNRAETVIPDSYAMDRNGKPLNTLCQLAEAYGGQAIPWDHSMKAMNYRMGLN